LGASPNRPFLLYSGAAYLLLATRSRNCLTASFVFHYFFAIEPVFYFITLRHNTGLVPLPIGFTCLSLAGIRSYKEPDGTVAISSHFSIRMLVIIQYLVFQAESRTFGFGLMLYYKVFYAAVGTFGQLKLKTQFKVIILIYGYNIAELFSAVATVSKSVATAWRLSDFC
jgi:hypothetical protein